VELFPFGLGLPKRQMIFGFSIPLLLPMQIECSVSLYQKV
jgi:hypothetical protein